MTIERGTNEAAGLELFDHIGNVTGGGLARSGHRHRLLDPVDAFSENACGRQLHVRGDERLANAGHRFEPVR